MGKVIDSFCEQFMIQDLERPGRHPQSGAAGILRGNGLDRRTVQRKKMAFIINQGISHLESGLAYVTRAVHPVGVLGGGGWIPDVHMQIGAM